MLKTNKPISTDDDLKSLIDNLGQQATEAHDLIHRATNKMLIEVGGMLLENRAALLPTIHSEFIQYARDLMSESRIQELPDLQLITSRCILSEIIATFQHHVIYACKVRKYGTLVYRPNSDLVVLLSEALWKMKQINAHVSIQCDTEDEYANTEKATNTRELCNINKLIHGQIDCYSSKKHRDYDELNLDEQISNISPQLWKAICCITQSKSELRVVSKVDDPHSPAHHVKRARRFFLLCVIMFSTDDKCSVPMHTLMTDLIESQGGSSVLIKILNRLGVCSSADTLSRFIQHKRTISEQHQFRHLSKDAFTVVSADNLDFLHSFATVFCGNQKSSWHGTTVQVAQPLPSLSLLTSYEVDTLSFKLQESMSSQEESLITCGLGQGVPESLVPHGNTLTSHRDTTTTRGEARETITHRGGLRDGPGERISGPEDTPTSCGELRSGMGSSHDSGDTHTLCDRPRDSLTPHDELKNVDSYADTLFISGLQNPVSRKRGERPSPLPSPMKLTKSPAPKLQRRLRTGTEGKYPQHQLHVHPDEFPHCPTHQSRHLTLSHFLCNDNEKESQRELESEMNSYIVHRVVFTNSSSQYPFLHLQDYCSLIRSTHTEVSKVIYLEMLDAVADCKDTMMVVLHNLRTRFIEERKMRWLVLEGDAKLYEVLKNLTFEYGEELNWLIPYPGDFHILMNYQKALMKPYYDAG